MPTIDKDPARTEIQTKSLWLIIKSELFLLKGSWNLEDEVLGSVVPSIGSPVSFDYLVNIRGENFLIFPLDLNAFQNLVDPSLADETTEHIIRLVAANGEIRQLHVTGNFTTSAPDRMNNTGFTDLEKVESELLQSQRLLTSVLNSSGNLIEVLQCVRNHGGNIVDFKWILTNRLAEQNLGHVIGKSLLIHNPGVVVSGLLEKYKQVVETGNEIQEKRYIEMPSAFAVKGVPLRPDLLKTKTDGKKWFEVTIVKLGDGIVVTSEDITEQKQVELWQRRSQEILDSMNDVCYQLDRDANMVFVNRKTEELFHIRKEDMIGRNVWDLFPELLKTDGYTAIQLLALEKKEYAQFEYISAILGRWISLRVTPTEEGGCIVLFHEMEDIMEARKKLQEEHRRLKEAQAVGRIGSFEWNAKTDKIYWSEELYKIHELKPGKDPLTIEQTMRYVHPEDSVWVLKSIMNARKAPGKGSSVHRLLLTDGRVRYVKRHFESFADAQGQVTHISGIYQDITEIKDAEEQLRKNLQILEQTEEVAEMGSWEFDREKNKFFWSEGMYKIFGLEKGTVVQPEIYFQAGADSEDPVLKKIVNIIRKEPRPFTEVVRIKAGGKIKTLKVKGTVLKNEKNEPVKLLGINIDVTAITKSEQALKEQSHFISRVVETIPDMICVVNLSTGKIEFVNKAPFAVEGFTVEDMLQIGPLEMVKMVHPDDQTAVKKYFKTFLFLQDEVVNTVEFRAQVKKGEWLWFRAHGKVFSRNESGAPTHCVNIAQNISVTKKSQDEIIRMKETLARQAQAQYQELFRSIDQGFAIIEMIFDDQQKSFNYLIQLANPALEKITGIKDITGKTLRELLPDAPEDWYLIYGNIIRTQQSLRFTIHAEQLGGAWYDIYAFPTGGVNSNKVAVLFNDITERKLSEEKLRDRQLKLEIAQRAARVGIWTYDLRMKQGIATHEWIELTGYPNTTEIWSLPTFLSLVHAEDAPIMQEAFDNAERKKGIDAEFRILHPKRGLLWLLMRGSYIPSENETNDSLVGSIIDITDRKIFEEQKDQFIGIASHELKTPVTSIKAYAEILQDLFAKRGDNKQSLMMERLVVQVNRLTKLINDLLDTTKITGGGLVLELETFDLNELIHERVEEIQRLTQHKLIIAEGPKPLVYADRDRIGQVLTNLLSNAIKYSPVLSEIIITTEVLPHDVKVLIRDFGIGLTEEAQKKVFERFFRVNDPHTNTIPGLGLGLFIASEIIRRHQGTIEVESRKEEGSVFYFTLPINPEHKL